MLSQIGLVWLASAAFSAAPTGDVKPPGRTDCGPNYLLPDQRARLGSHSFMILGRDGPEHVIAAHRSGTPPHNFQFLWRVRLSEEELAHYEALAARSQTLPALTTIAYSATGE